MDVDSPIQRCTRIFLQTSSRQHDIRLTPPEFATRKLFNRIDPRQTNTKPRERCAKTNLIPVACHYYLPTCSLAVLQYRSIQDIIKEFILINNLSSNSSRCVEDSTANMQMMAVRNARPSLPNSFLAARLVLASCYRQQ